MDRTAMQSRTFANPLHAILLSFPIVLFLAMGIYETWRRPDDPAPTGRN